MKNQKTILFLPSNANHVRIFSKISRVLQHQFRVLYLTQGTYKNEGAEEELAKLKINFQRFDSYKKSEPSFVLQQENVGVVIIGNDIDVIPQWFVYHANKLRIPSVLVQDGILFYYKTRSTGLLKSILKSNSNTKLKNLTGRLIISKQYKKITYGNGGCSKILAWGKTAKSYLTDKGIDANKIIVSGNLRSDEIKFGRADKNDVDENTILYAPSDLMYSNIISSKDLRNLSDHVCSTITSLENVKLIIKPHPREEVEFYKDLQERYEGMEVTQTDIYDLLPRTTLVITDLSSVAVEALAAKKPVIIFLPNIEKIVRRDHFPRDLVDRKCLLYAGSKKELFEHVAMILDGKWSPSNVVNKVLIEYLGNMDGMETKRSADIIEGLLDK